MAYLFGLFLVILVPSVLGVFAIVVPIRSHLRTKKMRFFVVGVTNAVFCGVAVLTLLASAVLNWQPGFILYMFIAVGFLAMLLVEATKRMGK